MSFLVVALLSLLWLGFFLPSLLQARRTSSPNASATTFQDSLRRLGEAPYPRPPHGHRQPAPPHARRSRRAAVAARRRDILAALGAAVIAGAALAVSFRGWAVWAPVGPVVALTAYVVMLRRDVARRVARGRANAAVRVHPRDVAAAAVRPGRAHAAVEEAEIVPSVARRTDVQPPERMAG